MPTACLSGVSLQIPTAVEWQRLDEVPKSQPPKVMKSGNSCATFVISLFCSQRPA
jgi:hypothetical protein